jgi:hypothetical protein
MLRSNGTAYADVSALLIAEPTVNGTGTVWAYDDVAGEAAEIAPGTTGQVLTATTGAQPSWTSLALNTLVDVTVSAAAEGDFLLRDATDFKNVTFTDEVDKYTYANADSLRKTTVFGANGVDSVDFDYKSYVQGGGAAGDFYVGTANEGVNTTLEYPEPGFCLWTMEIRVNDGIAAAGNQAHYIVKVTRQTSGAGAGHLASGVFAPPSSYVRSYLSSGTWSEWYPEGLRNPWYVEGPGTRNVTLSGLAHSHDGTYEMVLDRGYLGHSSTYVADSKYAIYYDETSTHCVMWDATSGNWIAFDTSAVHPSTWTQGQLVDVGTTSNLTANSENWGQITNSEMLRPASSDPNVTY